MSGLVCLLADLDAGVCASPGLALPAALHFLMDAPHRSPACPQPHFTSGNLVPSAFSPDSLGCLLAASGSPGDRNTPVNLSLGALPGFPRDLCWSLMWVWSQMVLPGGRDVY